MMALEETSEAHQTYYCSSLGDLENTYTLVCQFNLLKLRYFIRWWENVPYWLHLSNREMITNVSGLHPLWTINVFTKVDPTSS